MTCMRESTTEIVRGLSKLGRARKQIRENTETNFDKITLVNALKIGQKYTRKTK